MSRLKNCYILKSIIYIKFCSPFELEFSCPYENKESENCRIFRELLKFSAELDILQECLQIATVFMGVLKAYKIIF